eukprot:2485952-Karenia_brevis.AAC.1
MQLRQDARHHGKPVYHSWIGSGSSKIVASPAGLRNMQAAAPRCSCVSATIPMLQGAQTHDSRIPAGRATEPMASRTRPATAMSSAR